jgi:hypothetical protein
MNGDSLKGGDGMYHAIDEKKFGEWLRAASRQFRTRSDEVDTVEDDLNEIDPNWWWKDATLDEAASVFGELVAAIPADFDWKLVFIVLLKDSAELGTFPPDVNKMVPDDFFPPSLHLHASEWYMTPGPLGSWEQSWGWLEDPWGVTGDRTRVSFVRWGITHQFLDVSWDDQCQLKFTYSAHLGGEAVSAWAPNSGESQSGEGPSR